MAEEELSVDVDSRSRLSCGLGALALGVLIPVRGLVLLVLLLLLFKGCADTFFVIVAVVFGGAGDRLYLGDGMRDEY
jgi:hypothetical protein